LPKEKSRHQEDRKKHKNNKKAWLAKLFWTTKVFQAKSYNWLLLVERQEKGIENDKQIL